MSHGPADCRKRERERILAAQVRLRHCQEEARRPEGFGWCPSERAALWTLALMPYVLAAAAMVILTAG